MRELARMRSFGRGVSEDEVLATRGSDSTRLPLPPVEILAPYHVATAERRAGGPVEVRLWMHERDAAEYLERREREGPLDATIFRVLPMKERA